MRVVVKVLWIVAIIVVQQEAKAFVFAPVGSRTTSTLKPPAWSQQIKEVTTIARSSSRSSATTSRSSNVTGVGSTDTDTTTTTTTTTRTPTTTSESDFAASSSSFDVLFEGADSTVKAPLPPAYTACPFSGIMAGPQSFYRRASRALNQPKIFSFLHKDQPMVEVSGGKIVRDVLRKEFTTLSSNALSGISQKICGPNSLRTIRDPLEHKTLRQLIGVPLSPTAVERSIPRLETIGRSRITERINSGDIVTSWDMAQSMALDVTWQQILGLDLQSAEEIETFHEQTHTWLKGMWYPVGSPEFEATMQCKEYLRTAIDNKINQLLEAGESDGSTVGGLVFATMDDAAVVDKDNDNDNNTPPRDRTLTRQEVIDNCLLLILAGTETTATNVANAILLMGLHPTIWQKVIDEQAAVVARHGQSLSPQVLKDCIYLDAVINEMMRILPVTLVSRRLTQETIVVDDFQIPKGWGISYNMYLTHQNDSNLLEEEPDHMDLLKGFKPERWLQQQVAEEETSVSARPPAKKDYIPFGVGPRQCPGSFLAMTEMKAFVSLLAREMPEFELVNLNSNDNNIPIEEQIEWNKLSSLITPADGVRIRILPATATATATATAPNS